MLPKVPLTDWQRAYLLDRNQFRWLAASRQSGKSHGLSLDNVMQCVERPRNLEIALSRGERQSLELMHKAQMHCQAMGALFDAVDGFFQDTSIAQHTIAFPNGSRIIGLPANPDTARGYSGNVTLDEFALHKDSREIWASLAPSATRGYRISMASTFKGTANKFWEIGRDMGLHTGVRPERQPVQAGVWSGHWVDIHMSAEQTLRALGLRIDVEKLRAAIGDEEVWLQEFENVPMSDAESFIPLEMVLACESEEASLEFDYKVRPGQCAGFDVARVKDGSVIAIGAPAGDTVTTHGMVWLDRLPFAAQREAARKVAAVIEEGGGRFAIDATGIGAQLAEELAEEFSCVEPVQFATRVETGAREEDGKAVSVPVKEQMAMGLKRRMEEHGLLIPESPKVRRAMSAVKRLIGATGAVRFDAARTSAGHADEFWALALMCAAMTAARSYVPASAVGLVGRAATSGLLGKVF